MIELKLDENYLKEYSINLNELFVLLVTIYPRIEFKSTPVTHRRLIDKGYLEFTNNKFRLTEVGETIVSKFVNPPKKVDELELLAEELRGIYPMGKKGGQYYWRGSTSEITKKLRVFFKKYGNSYTPDQIVLATKSYIRSFSERDQDKAMMLLKYFIEKNGTSTLTSFVDIKEELGSLKIDYGTSRSL